MKWLSLAVCLFLLNNRPPAITNESVPAGPPTLNVLAYYSGNSSGIDGYAVDKLSHIIFSFCHLKGNRLSVDNAKDSATIRKLVSLKKKHPRLKIMLSLGGWGGCEFCSPVFSTESGRKEFAASVQQLNNYFKTDGIDLDWEYPAIEGYPGHAYKNGDRNNFTELVKELRKVLGTKNEVSFAAGGFTKFITESIDWLAVMPLVDRVNLMSYDLVGGYSKITGHHTPLYSNPRQVESADHAIGMFDSMGISRSKIVIGAAFYARTWENVADTNRGLYQPGVFKNFIAYREFENKIGRAQGFTIYRDSVSRAAWAYNKKGLVFATFDDTLSIREKVHYAIVKGLNGIMFWELSLDKRRNGLLDVIDRNLRKHQH